MKYDKAASAAKDEEINMKTLVMTHTETDPLWQDWSAAVAYAESLPVGSDAEVAAWARADELWERFVAASHNYYKTYNAAVDGLHRLAASIRQQVDAEMDNAAGFDDYLAELVDLDATMDAACGRYGF